MAMAAGKLYWLGIFVVYRLTSVRLDFGTCKQSGVDVDVLSRKSLILCAVDRVTSPDLVYAAATLTPHVFDLLQSIPDKQYNEIVSEFLVSIENSKKQKYRKCKSNRLICEQKKMKETNKKKQK